MSPQPIAGDAAAVLDATAAFAAREGRRPRVLVSPAGPGDLDPAPWVLVTTLADLGFDVDVAAGTGGAGDIARQAVDNDVHLVAVPVPPIGPSPAGLRAALTAGGGDRILVVSYGAGIPDPAGASVGRFTPDTGIAITALAVTDVLVRHLASGPTPDPADLTPTESNSTSAGALTG